MRIIEIEIGRFKILKRNSVKLKGPQVFPKGSQILWLIWANWSWKTTLCSSIAWIFHSIFTRKKVEFNIKIKFEYKNRVRTIECKDSNIKLFIEKKLYYEFKLGSRLRSEEKDFHDWKVENFWGGKVVLSTFETNWEYPNKKPFNYSWEYPTIKYDLAWLYGKNSYGFPSITNWIIRFLNNNSKQNIADIFLQNMWFKLSWKVDLKIVGNVAGYRSQTARFNNIFELDEELRKISTKEDNSIENFLSKKISKDRRLKLTPLSQSLSFSDVQSISNDYSEYMWKYIFLNWLWLLKDGEELSFEDLSSWEKFLIMRYISILSWIENDSIIIIEEPENHLNLKWRELIIPALHKAATEFNSTLIFTTHDYRIIRYLHNDCVLNLSKGKIKNTKELTLLCDEFDFESLGEGVIPFIYEDLKKVYDLMNSEEKRKLLNSMCEVEEKMYLRREFLNKYEKN